MSEEVTTITIPKVRQGSSVRMTVALLDNGVRIDWSSLTDIMAFIYSDAQKVIAGPCTAVIDDTDSEKLICTYDADAPQYLGINSLVIRCKYLERKKTFDAKVLEFVSRTEDLSGEAIVLEDPDLAVTISVEEVSTSLLDDAIAAAINAAAAAQAAAAVAEGDHTRAESDHTRAEEDHTAASSDHIQADSDHSAAVEDHSTALRDHSTATEDHTRADSDHSTAASDHNTAQSDHTAAAADRAQAGTDHARAENDHSRAEADHAAQINQSARLADIESKIPTQASSSNQLADKAYVDNKVSTDTATYRGAYNLVSDLLLSTSATQAQIATALATAVQETPDNNDYCYVQIPTSDDTPSQIARVDRYKHNGEVWRYEYTLNNSGFTADQWAALNSGITPEKVAEFYAKYTKPAGGIPESDLAQAVKDKLNLKEIFVAIYGFTVHSEIQAAYEAGKFIVAEWTGEIYMPFAYRSTEYQRYRDFIFYNVDEHSGKLTQIKCAYNGTPGGDWSDELFDIRNAIAAKQDTLVSGTNIKTINNQSILGEGNLEISGGGAQTNKVIAEAIAVLWYEFNALLEKISDGSLHLKVASIDAVDYGSMGTPIMTEGDGAPSFVPTIPGQGYFNKTQNKWYKAKMTLTNSIGDWIALN